MAIFRQEDDVLMAHNEWADYMIARHYDSNHVMLSIILTAEEYDNVETAKDISGAVDGWFFVEKSVRNAVGDDE